MSSGVSPPHSSLGSRTTGSSVDRFSSRLREITGAFQGGWNTCSIQECAYCLAQAPVREEKEGLVLFDRTAYSDAKLVAMVRSPGECRCVLICIEHRVANELKGRAVKLVGAIFGKHVDDAAGIAAILRIVAVRLDPKFLDCIGIGQDITLIPKIGHIGAAVEVVVNGGGAAVGAAVDQCSLFRITKNEVASTGGRRYTIVRLSGIEQEKHAQPAEERLSQLPVGAANFAELVFTSGALVTVTSCSQQPQGARQCR